MDCLTAIHARRSIRSYTGAPVTDHQVETLLRAAMAAPSAGNAQPWEFLVVRDRATLADIPGVHPYARMAASADAAILVCGDLSRERYHGYWVQDCAAAVQNLLLAATALGLGAVWTGVHPVPERVAGFREMFRLPEHIVPLAFIPLGHPAEDKPPVDRFDPARIRAERWS